MSTPVAQGTVVQVFESWGPTTLRVGVGSAMMVNGAGKVFGWGPRALGMEAFSSYIASLGIPFPVALAWIAAFAELVGGLLILVGLFTRAAAIFTGITMGVALLMVHIPAGFPTRTIGTAYTVGEYTVVLLVASLALIFLGAGKLSLERAIFGRELVPDVMIHTPTVLRFDDQRKRKRLT